MSQYQTPHRSSHDRNQPHPSLTPTLTPEKPQNTDSTEMRDFLRQYEITYDDFSRTRGANSEVKNRTLFTMKRMLNTIKELEQQIKSPGHQNAQEIMPQSEAITLQLNQTNTQISSLTEQLTEMKETIDRYEDLITSISNKINTATKQTMYTEITDTTPIEKQKTSTIYKPHHALKITSCDPEETSEHLLHRLRLALQARKNTVEIQNIRKIRDQRLLLTFSTMKELEYAQQILEHNQEIVTEHIKNKNPLVILKNIYIYNTDEDIIQSIKEQNTEIIKHLDEEEHIDTIKIKYKRKTRNPNQNHVILQVTPELWQVLTTAQHIYIDVQRIRVEDQTPLIQCTNCLKFGHGRKTCRDTTTSCTHCGGPHCKAECEAFKTRQPPKCTNCKRDNRAEHNHSIFSQDCPTRRKWDKLARLSVGYPSQTL